ncbi:partner of Y14 and mago isoform X2 [Bombina bombina]|uniref:partner of Y14 and mago isoform X2 n=1 Tax=Bombina bombina TaxID=8345 RepID=UPI00235ABCA0|nr:partner of Y14 and mago isoform X2 [Bombina bombina]
MQMLFYSLTMYENKYVKFFKSKPDLPPGMSPVDVPAGKAQQPSKPDSETNLSKTAKRNLKRKEKRKQEKGEREVVEETRNELEKVTISEPAVLKDGSENASAEKAKKIKNLRKKLRQIEDLQQKIDSGEIKQPTKEQQEKLGRRKALEEELEDLELDL